MGARLMLKAGALTQVREVAGGGSYLSQSDLRQHFGLGEAAKVDNLEVRWPSGLRQVFVDIAADRFYVIEEGKQQLISALIKNRH
jgi:enediyne biosynthesis protein E4